jgi:hypothetical protein
MNTLRSLGLAAFAAGTVSLCAAQAAVSFSKVTSSSGVTPANIYTVDLNNDGITDIIQDTAQSPDGFTVSLGNGDGTFKAPVEYRFPDNNLGFKQIATADVNNDGKADVVVGQSGTNQILVYLGNGDGTLQGPKISTIALASGFTWETAGFVVADFNGDGRVDVAGYAGSSNGSVRTASQLYVVEGDGTGGFSNPHMILAGPPVFPNFQLFAGDFDADGKTDLATTQPVEDSEGGTASTPIYVLYGNNDFTFTKTNPYTQNGNLTIAAGDLDSDGITDLYGDNESQLTLFYGTRSRTFASYFPSMQLKQNEVPTSMPDGWEWTPQYALADFNGDTHMDLAAFSLINGNTQSEFVRFYLAGPSRGQFTRQDIAIPFRTWDTAPVPSLFGTIKPALVLNQSNNGGSPPQNTPSFLTSLVNQDGGSFGPCPYPSNGQGFNVCNAGGGNGSSSVFHATADSIGELRKIELWVDGKKVTEQHHAWDHHAWFNYTASFPAGIHKATLIAADVDNRLQKHSFSFTGDGGTCSTPFSDSVHVCSPVSGTTVSSPVNCTATAKISGTLARMEIWVDGVKKYSETTSLRESTSIALPAGSHKFTFNAINTTGTKWATSVFATVK